jgi:hypothetical protein
MDSWIIWIVGVSVAYWIGHTIGGHMKAYQMMQNMIHNPDGMLKLIDQLKKINEEELESGKTIPDDAILVETEEVNGMVYAYDKLTGEFLAQAHNLHQVMTLAAQRFPGKKFWHPEIKEDTQTA